MCSERKPRDGSQVDIRNLGNMFYELGYEYETWTDLDIHSYNDKMKSLTNQLKTRKYGCLLFFFMCHGNENQLKLENCKKHCCHENVIKREEFENAFLKTEDTKDLAIILFMNNCRIPSNVHSL